MVLLLVASISIIFHHMKSNAIVATLTFQQRDCLG